MNKPFDFIKNDQKSTVADQKINDAMILLSKKVDEIIAKNNANKAKIARKVDFVENQYVWQIEALEKALNKKITKANASLKNALKNVEPTYIKEKMDAQKVTDVDFIKAKNKVLVDRLELEDQTEITKAKIASILEGEKNDIVKIEQYYENATKDAIRNQNQSEAKKIQSEHDNKIRTLRNEFESKKKELSNQDVQTKSSRMSEAEALKKTFTKQLLDSENVTNTQIKIYQEFTSSQSELSSDKAQLSALIKGLEKDRSRKALKQIDALEAKVKELENKKITKTKPVSGSEASALSRQRIEAINEGIKNNVNVLVDCFDPEMLPDLIPSFHTYKINPLIKPNNTYFAHKYHGMYKGVKFTLALLGAGFGVLLMVLYTLFSIQSAQTWISAGAEALGGAAGDAFTDKMNLGYNTLFDQWGLPADYWNAVLAFGILLLIFSTFAISIRNHTIWSYCSISLLAVTLIIGFALSIDVMVKMDFGVADGANTLIMTKFRNLSNLVKGGNEAGAVGLFKEIMGNIGATIPAGF